MTPSALSTLLAGSTLLFCAEAAAGGSKACAHSQFYSKKVVPLCEKHFPEPSSKHAWLIQFFHPYVKSMVSLQAIYEEIASDLDKLDGAKVGAVDCAHNGEFCQKHGVAEVPTTRVNFQGHQRDFSGEYTADGIREFVKTSMKRFKELEEGMKCSVKGAFTDAKKDAALPLCTSSFPLNLEQAPWLVSFYESGDRNKDKTQRSVMNKLAEKFGNAPPQKMDAKSKTLKMRVGAVDCSEQKGCDELGITTFPTVRFYTEGADPVDFDDSFDRAEIQKWADGLFKKLPKKATVAKIQADMDVPEGKASQAKKEL